MKTNSIETAQTSLNQLVPTPIRASKPRKAGSAQGQVWMSDDFDHPLDDFAEYMG